SNFSVSSMSSLNGNFYIAGVNSQSGLCEEIEFGPSLSLLNSKVLNEYGSYNPNYWVANNYYADNGFITVGGNGLSFYNGTFEAPSSALPGYLTAAAWDGNAFLVGGITYGYTITTSTGYTYNGNSGPLMALYYPNNDTLVNITGAIPTINSLQKTNGSIYQVTWNGSVFFVLGEYGNLSTGSEKLLLFTYDPTTGVAKNVSDLIPLSQASSMTGMLSTDNGTFILLYKYNNMKDYLYEINTQGEVENFSSIFKFPFNFNDYNGYGTPMAYGDGFLFIGGNYFNGSLFALAYNVQNKSSINFEGALSNVMGEENQVAFDDGVFLLYGTSGSFPNYTSLLLTFDPVTDQVSNISGFIPSNFANKNYGLDGMSSNGSSVFLTGGVFGNIVYGTLNLTFSYPITFTETGLPSGAKWYVILSNGQSFSSTTSTISFFEPIGTYSYTIVTADKMYRPSSYSGSFTVNDAPVSENITFIGVTYTVTFTETGLPSGTRWYVNIDNGLSLSSTTSSIPFRGPKGPYSYTISAANKSYEPSPSSGSFTLNGSSYSIPVTFSLVTFSITITEVGLPSGTMWYVILSNGQSFSSTTSSISFNEPNGTYSYTIINEQGYNISASKGSVSVNGGNVSKIITFTAVAKSPPLSNVSSIETFSIISVALVGTAVTGSLVVITRKKR
ncbi:MAG: hypothetical protein QXU98_14155, partial [Candidatus Parvarchaeota archaeon]